MKQIIYNLIAIVLMLIIGSICLFTFEKLNSSSKNKYEIGNFNGILILYDKSNGLAWRNVRCDKETGIPNCWEFMEYSGAVVPDGEQQHRDFKFKKGLYF